MTVWATKHEKLTDCKKYEPTKKQHRLVSTLSSDMKQSSETKEAKKKQYAEDEQANSECHIFSLIFITFEKVQKDS